jgi:hypothetical protein
MAKDGKKTGGRQKGTPNKLKAGPKLLAMELGIDPFEVLLKFAANDWKGLGYSSPEVIKGYDAKGNPLLAERITAEIRRSAAADACKYIHPQLKAVESKIEGTVAVEKFEDYLKRMKEDGT